MLRAQPVEVSPLTIATPVPSRHARAASFDLHLLTKRPASPTVTALSPANTPLSSRSLSPILSERVSSVSLMPDAILTEEPVLSPSAVAQEQVSQNAGYAEQETTSAFTYNEPYAPPPVFNTPLPPQGFPMMAHPFAPEAPPALQPYPPMLPVVPALVDIRPILQEREHLQQQLHHKDAELLQLDSDKKSLEAQSQRYIEKLQESVFLEKQHNKQTRNNLNTINNRYNQELIATVAEIQLKDRTIAHMETEKQNIALQVETTKAERDQLDMQNEALQSRILVLEENLAKQEQDTAQHIQKSTATLAQTKQSFAYSSANLKATIAALEGKQADLEKALAAKESQITALEQKNTALQNDLDTANAHSQTVLNESRSLVQKRDQAIDLNTRELRQVKGEKASLQQQVKELQSRIPKTKSQTQDIARTADTSSLQRALDKQDTTISALSKELETVKLEKEDAARQAEQANQRTTTLETENARLQRQLAEMTELLRTTEQQRDGYRDATQTKLALLEKITQQRDALLEQSKPASTLKPALAGASLTFAAAALARLANR